MEFVPILALGTFVFTLVIFLKNLSARQWRSVVTQLVAWAAGVVGVFLMAATQFAGGISVGNMSLDRLDFWSKFLLGLLATSLLSSANEFKKAIDRTDTAVVPDWFDAKNMTQAQKSLTLPADIATAEAMDEARRQVSGTRSSAEAAPEK